VISQPCVLVSGRGGCGKSQVISRLTHGPVDLPTQTLGLQVTRCRWPASQQEKIAQDSAPITSLFEFWEVTLESTATSTAHCYPLLLANVKDLTSSGGVCSCHKGVITAVSGKAFLGCSTACLFSDRQSWLQ